MAGKVQKNLKKFRKISEMKGKFLSAVFGKMGKI